MLKKLTRLMSISILLLPAISFAGGSIYSLQGYGTFIYYPGGRASGMGGAVLASANSTNLNWLNPAALAVQNHVRISGQFLWNLFATQSMEQSYRSNYANFNGFMAAFPIKQGIGVGFGIQPYTRLEYRFESREDLTSELYYHSMIYKRGGLSRAYLSLGIQIHPRLLMGAGAAYFFGRVGEHWWLVYNKNDFVDTHDEIRSKFSGTHAYLGLLTIPIPGWTIGAVYQSKAVVTENIDRFFYVPNHSESRQSEFEIPEFWGIGTSVFLNKRMSVAVDYIEQDWNNLNGGNGQLTVFKRLSCGFEYAEPQRLSMSYWERIRYRLGFAIGKPYFLDFNGRKLKEYKITIGFGLPFSSGAGAVDVAFEFGKRGAKEKNDFGETIFGMSLFVSGGELWFQR